MGNDRAVNCLKAEWMKQKHRFTVKLLWLGPVVTIALVTLLMSGRYFTVAAYNWWYTMLLPGALTMIIAFSVSAEKKYNHHGLFAVCPDKGSLWLAQICLNTIWLLVLNGLFFVLVSVGSLIFAINLSIVACLLASLVLVLTFMWQIPLWMVLAEKTGPFVTIIISIVCNMGFGIFFAATRCWYVPFAIPSRLMCPMLGVLPNGLPVEAGNPLGNPSVIPCGILMTVVLYVVLTVLTTLWFRHREVR